MEAGLVGCTDGTMGGYPHNELGNLKKSALKSKHQGEPPVPSAFP